MSGSGCQATDRQAILVLLADGVEKLGRFIVLKIQAWEDVRSDCGILVTSWDIQQNQVVERWV